MRRLAAAVSLALAALTAAAQERAPRAVLPAFHSRVAPSGSGSPLRLDEQRILLAVYRNAVAAWVSASFVNPGLDTLDEEFSLPSAGHGRSGALPGGVLSSGIHDVQLSIAGRRVAASLLRGTDGDCYVIRDRIAPGDGRTVEALYWAATSAGDTGTPPGLDTTVIAPGPRAFLVDLGHAGAWQGPIARLEVTAEFHGGLRIDEDSVVATPDTYVAADSVISWTFLEIDPDAGDDVALDYRPAGAWAGAPNTMARLSAFLATRGYDALLHRARQEE